LQTAEAEYEQLPPEIVSFRRGLIDMFWDQGRLDLFGDETCGDPDSFVGRCPDCGQRLDVWFHSDRPAVKLRCIGGCDVALVHRLGLRG
jgi:hypothetical protein